MVEALAAVVLSAWIGKAQPSPIIRRTEDVPMIYTFEPPEPGMDEDGGWYHVLVNSECFINDQYGSVSSPNALSVFANYAPFYWGDASAGKVVPTQAGGLYLIASMVNASASHADVTLTIRVYDKDPGAWYGALLGEFTITKAQLGAGWQLWNAGAVTATSGNIIVEVLAKNPAKRFDGRWVLDNFAVTPQGGEEMAVMLTEYAVRAVLHQLQSYLNAEIAMVELDANLGLDLPTVEGWREFDPGVATPDTVDVEVFEMGNMTFPAQKYDQSQWNGGRTRVLSQIPIRVALNHANRGNITAADESLKASQMAQRSRLYLAALVRTIRNDPTCGTFQTVIIVPGSARTRVLDNARLDSDIRRCGRVELDLDVRLAEVPLNEGVLGSGNLPSITTAETP